MLAATLEAEVDSYIAELTNERDEAGRPPGGPQRPPPAAEGDHVGRGGRGEGAPGQRQARRRGDGRAQMVLVGVPAAWCRKSPKIAEVLPLLYLHGLSTGDFVPAMEQFLGSSAGLSPATVTRLTTQWQADHQAFMDRDLSATDYVYVWADGVHLRIRLEEAKAAVLVLIGVRADGAKELIALDDGYRESAEAWAALMRDCARRGMRAPVLAVGDGALGFWKARREVLPDTAEQRCWVHKTANVLDALPKSAQPAAKKAIQDIYNAEDKNLASAAIRTFAKLYGAKFPKAVAKITNDEDVLLTFYDYPAEHWIHLRTTNPIESTFATVRHRPPPDQGHPGRRQPRGRAGRGLQADRVRSGPLAGRQRRPPGPACPRRSPLRTRPARRARRGGRGMTRPLVVLVNGLPGAGKTTLARALSQRMGLPLFSKDTIKEAHADVLGTEPPHGGPQRRWNAALGAAASETM
ncbi:IS256 family transposase [Kitasatospora sp. NPDC050543]|uniref:IS256 family transposase n=1 Tax=Kitasatospora sp. NPDC050543 TaxID=3364054 RepID=UPI0037AE332F